MIAEPYDNELNTDVKLYFIKYNLYPVIQDKTEKNKVNYTKVSPDDVISELLYVNFHGQALPLNKLLEKFRNWNMFDCEVASTLYTAWNNRILRYQLIDYSVLKQDLLERSVCKELTVFVLILLQIN